MVLREPYQAKWRVLYTESRRRLYWNKGNAQRFVIREGGSSVSWKMAEDESNHTWNAYKRNKWIDVAYVYLLRSWATCNCVRTSWARIYFDKFTKFVMNLICNKLWIILCSTCKFTLNKCMFGRSMCAACFNGCTNWNRINCNAASFAHEHAFMGPTRGSQSIHASLKEILI